MSEIITGTHAIEETIKTKDKNGTLYLLRDGKNSKNLEKLALCNPSIVVKKVPRDVLDNISKDNRGAALLISGKSTNKGNLKKQGGLYTINQVIESLENKEKAIIAVLDGITDPHNLGAIMRSADCFSVDAVVIPKVRAVGLNETVKRVSSGASQYVPLVVSSNIARDLKLLKEAGFWLYGADMKGENIAKCKFSFKSVIVLGREGEGLHSIVKGSVDYLVSIPISGHIDSLNVSVAAGIFFCYARLII